MSLIECDCSCEDFDPAKVYQTTIRHARKVHKCCECHKEILPGAEYEEVTGIDIDGDPFRHRTCIICKRIRDHYCPHGFLFGELGTTLYECLGWDYTEVPEDDDDA